MRSRAGLLSLLLLLGLPSLALPAGGSALLGETGAHDPSRIVRCNDRYWVFVTGPRGPSRFSRDRVTWEAGPDLFPDALPPWVSKLLPDKRDPFIWAPDVVHYHDRYYLYYSVSATFGRNESAIGLLTNPTLDPADPKFHWTDAGPVIVSVAKPVEARQLRGNWDQHDAALKNDTFNAIDPAPFADGDRLWLTFGSFWSGIYLVPLDPRTGGGGPPRPPS